MHSRTRDLLARGWRSEANLSLFLFLLIVVGFVLPSLGFEKHNLPLLRRHHVYRGIGRWGCDRLGRQKSVRTDSARICRGDCGAVGDVVGPNKDAHGVESIDGAGRNSCDCCGIALAGVPLGVGHHDARPRSDCGLSVPWFRLGTCLPSRGIIGSRCFQRCRERRFDREHLGQL